MRKIAIVLILLVSFSIVSCQTMPSSTQSDGSKVAQIYYEMAKNIIVNKDYSKLSEAFVYLNKAKDIEPSNPNIYFIYALAYRLKKDDNTAKQYLEKTINLDKNYYDAYNELGVIYYEEGNYSKAKELFDKLIDTLTYPNIDVAYYNRAILYLTLKENHKAVNDLESAIMYSDYKNPLYWQKLIEVYLNENNYQKVLIVAQEMESHLGPSDYIHYIKALCYYHLGLFDQAKDSLSKINNQDNYFSIEKDLLLKKMQR
ncbi:MAG: tetratricopeptide repeat protein [Desulfurella sp.]|uniref:Tfp pilus assembly protein PilF n=1 Tax=Desulfurella multipotens TaxID=79269 RepID=A0A1G6JZP3_9BACT|nr:tetratricopeptide repeat protein [Desulfurella multipotens]SDC24098.1 Tfp pilus assembly protein PilF [Desulfurella multipotens]